MVFMQRLSSGPSSSYEIQIPSAGRSDEFTQQSPRTFRRWTTLGSLQSFHELERIIALPPETVHFSYQLADVLEKNPNALIFKKNQCGIGGRFQNVSHLKDFSRKLKSSVSLKALYLADSGLNSVSIASFAKALTRNPSLRLLDLSGNPCGYDDLELLFNALSVNRRISILILRRNGLMEWGLSQLAKLLQENSGFKILDLTNNYFEPHNLDDKPMECFASALRVNLYLKTLILANCYISSWGASLIFEALKDNVTLSELSLRNNEIKIIFLRLIYSETEKKFVGTVEINAFVELLRVNRALRKIDLRDNHVDIQGVVEFCRASRENPTPREIDLRNNNKIGFSEVYQIIEEIKVHPFLTLKLSFGNQEITLQNNSGVDELSSPEPVEQSNIPTLQKLCFSQLKKEGVAILVNRKG